MFFGGNNKVIEVYHGLWKKLVYDMLSMSSEIVTNLFAAKTQLWHSWYVCLSISKGERKVKRTRKNNRGCVWICCLQEECSQFDNNWSQYFTWEIWRWQEEEDRQTRLSLQKVVTFQRSSSLQKIVSEGEKRVWKSHVKCGTNKKQLMQAWAQRKKDREIHSQELQLELLLTT